jgi:lipoprotein-anchoring transpeptidase ErfK/SrfK
MKFRAIIRSLQALAIIAVAQPLVAQPTQPVVNSPEPANTTPQSSAPKSDVAPVLTPEPSVNNPTTTQPPVITPAPNPTPPLAPPPNPVAKRAKADSLKPGQFMWEKRDSYNGRLKIVIVLNVQRIYVFHDDKLVGFSTISSGKKGKETPTGIFNILQKNIDHKSNLYSNAPMPYMQRLTWDGIALHGGHIPGHPASHGCIRLPQAFAKALFGATKMNQEVFVLSDVDTPVTRPVAKPVPVIDPPVVPPVVDQPVEPVVVPPVTPEGT